jgi:hypothetical protein
MSIAKQASSAADFVAAVEQAILADDPSSVSDEELRRVLSAATKIYAAKSEAAGRCPSPIDATQVTPTEVVTLVSEMLRAADLNVFDLAMWFRRPSGC